MNRMGIKHEVHDEWQNNSDTNSHARSASKDYDGNDKLLGNTTLNLEPDPKDEYVETPSDALNELLKKIRRDNTLQFEKPYPKRHILTPRSAPQIKTKPQEIKTEKPEEDRILDSKDPHDIFGISKNATIVEIKIRHRELVKKYDPSKGIIHKTDSERERSGKIMVKINHTFAQLKKIHRDTA